MHTRARVSESAIVEFGSSCTKAAAASRVPGCHFVSLSLSRLTQFPLPVWFAFFLANKGVRIRKNLPSYILPSYTEELILIPVSSGGVRKLIPVRVSVCVRARVRVRVFA